MGDLRIGSPYPSHTISSSFDKPAEPDCFEIRFNNLFDARADHRPASAADTNNQGEITMELEFDEHVVIPSNN